MHRVIKAHLNSFIKSFGFEKEEESSQFEKFVNYCVLSPRTSSSFYVEEVTTDENDDGIDGIAIIIDEEVILSSSDAEAVFSSHRRNHEVEIIFTQSKTSEKIDLGDFLKFKEAVLRFINADDNYSAVDEVQTIAHDIFNQCLENVPKIKNGKPSLVARFVITGTYAKPVEVERAVTEFQNSVQKTGFFQAIDVKVFGREELVALWVETYSGVNARLEMFSHAPLPAISGIEEAYLAVVKAKAFVSNLLISDDGNLINQVFEENVRAFLGIDNSVNQSINETINSGDKASRFPVLNNGITILCQDVRIQNNILHLSNYQIVNGCQTSHVLYENKDNLDDALMITLKVVETANEDVFSEVVKATNSQTRIDNTQFISLRPLVKKIERYFNSFEGADGRLFFERRDKQFVGKDIPAIRIISLHNATRSVCAMFCQRPELSYRYTKTMYVEFTDKIFADSNKESMFYAAAMTLYRLHLLVSNNTIPQNMKRYKWHILPIVYRLICGEEYPQFSSRKMDTNCEKIIKMMSHHNDETLSYFTEAVNTIQALGEMTDDRLKRQTTFIEMLTELEARQRRPKKSTNKVILLKRPKGK